MNNHFHAAASAPVMPFRTLKVILLAMALVFAYHPAIRALAQTWSVRDIYSYGFFVPVASLMWIWHEKEKLRRLPVRPSIIAGLSLMAIGGLLLVFGSVSSVAILEEISIVVAIPGLVLTLLGIRWYLALVFPLSYLVLMVPVLDGVIDKLHWPFQIFAAATAVKILNFLNVPAFQNGQFIELPDITLQVANACSGVRFLMSTMVLSIPLAFIALKNWKQRILLLLFALFLSICTNPLRVTLIAAWAYYRHGDIHGPLHIFQGYVVYVIGMVFLFAAAGVLRRMSRLQEADINKGERTMTEGAQAYKLHRAWLLAFMMLVCIGLYLQLFRSQPVQLFQSLHKMPPVIGTWEETGGTSDAAALSLPVADFELQKVYRNPSGREVRLQIIYDESQNRSRKLNYYKLQTLYADSSEIVISEEGRGPVRISRAAVRQEAGDSLILFWYQVNGRILANRYAAKLLTAYDGVVRNRTNGAAVFVSSAVSAGGMDGALRDETDFVRSLLPVLEKFIP